MTRYQKGGQLTRLLLSLALIVDCAILLNAPRDVGTPRVFVTETGWFFGDFPYLLFVFASGLAGLALLGLRYPTLRQLFYAASPLLLYCLFTAMGIFLFGSTMVAAWHYIVLYLLFLIVFWGFGAD